MAEKKKVEEVVYKNQTERLQAAKNLAKDFNKRLGFTSIQLGSDIENVQRQSCNVPEVDSLLGGGFAKGIFQVIWGDEGSGKTTLALSLVAQAQREGKICYWVALETLDIERAALLGVDLDKLIIGSFPVAEQCLDSIREYAQNKLVDVIVLDSIHSLAPASVMQEKNGDIKSIQHETMALLARKLSGWFPTVLHYIKTANITPILIAQTRTNLGGFIAFECLTGGRALKHYSKLILHIRKGQKADAPTEKIVNEDGKKEERIIGFDCSIKIDKTQITGTQPELSKIHIPFYFASGFSQIKQKELLNTEDVLKEELKDPEFKKEYEKQAEVLKKKRGRPAKA
jgi:recombination protein RecA